MLFRNSLSLGEWCHKKHAVKLMLFSGVLKMSLGHTSDGESWLDPEEALYVHR